MKQVNMNPAAAQMVAAWTAAKDAEKQWTTYRRQVEEQILELHPGLLDDLQRELEASHNLSVTAELGTLKLEVKRTLELDQTQVGAILAEAPFLAGVLVKCEWKPVASRAMFGALASQGEIAAKLKEAVTFRPQRPYFSAL